MFSTESGGRATADDITLTGRGLDIWSRLPGLSRMVIVGRILRANRDAREAYRQMLASPEYRQPVAWADTDLDGVDGLLLPGGHRARGMRSYRERGIATPRLRGFHPRTPRGRHLPRSAARRPNRRSRDWPTGALWP